MSLVDLNKLRIPGKEGDDRPLDDNSIQSMSAQNFFTHFRDLDCNLVNYIRQADAIMGCVAWLTSRRILQALEGKKASIVVQKEDFLRPDIGAKDYDWRKYLRSAYSKLKPLNAIEIGGVVTEMGYCGSPDWGPVRCVGNYNRAKSPAFPRMHNKFMLFCKHGTRADLAECDMYYTYYAPYAVWTGSFNFTQNAAYSFENAIYTTDMDITQAYWSEFTNILALSEPLDWTYDWVEPEYCIGT